MWCTKEDVVLEEGMRTVITREQSTVQLYCTTAAWQCITKSQPRTGHTSCMGSARRLQMGVVAVRGNSQPHSGTPARCLRTAQRRKTLPPTGECIDRSAQNM